MALSNCVYREKKDPMILQKLSIMFSHFVNCKELSISQKREFSEVHYNYDLRERFVKVGQFSFNSVCLQKTN